jgi:hypothetical protein
VVFSGQSGGSIAPSAVSGSANHSVLRLNGTQVLMNMESWKVTWMVNRPASEERNIDATKGNPVLFSPVRQSIFLLGELLERHIHHVVIGNSIDE